MHRGAIDVGRVVVAVHVVDFAVAIDEHQELAEFAVRVLAHVERRGRQPQIDRFQIAGPYRGDTALDRRQIRRYVRVVGGNQGNVEVVIDRRRAGVAERDAVARPDLLRGIAIVQEPDVDQLQVNALRCIGNVRGDSACWCRDSRRGRVAGDGRATGVRRAATVRTTAVSAIAPVPAEIWPQAQAVQSETRVTKTVIWPATLGRYIAAQQRAGGEAARRHRDVVRVELCDFVRAELVDQRGAARDLVVDRRDDLVDVQVLLRRAIESLRARRGQLRRVGGGRERRFARDRQLAGVVQRVEVRSGELVGLMLRRGQHLRREVVVFEIGRAVAARASE